MLSVAIMAHPVRRRQVEQLQAKLDGPVPVYWDPDPVPAVDPDRVWATCTGAWRMVDRSADWGLVLQDDVIACRDLLAGVRRALVHVPADSVVSFYMFGHRYIRTTGIDALSDGSWLRRQQLVSGQAIAVPARMIDGMLTWCEHQGGLLDDNRIANYFRSVHGWPAYFSVPSLVDHEPDRSLLGHQRGRTAYRFIGAARSALDIEWSKADV